MHKFFILGKSEQTRAFIIEKTAPLFNTKGYAGTSISDVTEATGLTKGSVYGNFENKDEVALAAFDHNWKQVNSVLSAEIAKRSSITEKLLAYGVVYSDFSAYHLPLGGCPLLNTATEADDTHPELKKKVVKALHAWKKNLAGLIEKGKEVKEFKKSTNAEQAALTIIALIEGCILITRVTGNKTYRSMLIDALTQYIHSMK